MKGPAFTIDGNIITETKTGSTGKVRITTTFIIEHKLLRYPASLDEIDEAVNKRPEVKTGYAVEQLEYKGKPGKEQALYSRMTNWYYFTQVQKSKTPAS